jgi:hypothetical protein
MLGDSEPLRIILDQRVLIASWHLRLIIDNLNRQEWLGDMYHVGTLLFQVERRLGTEAFLPSFFSRASPTSFPSFITSSFVTRWPKIRHPPWLRVGCRGILHDSESIRYFSEALYALALVCRGYYHIDCAPSHIDHYEVVLVS